MIKSLSLSFDEIRQLIEISDPEHRRQVLRSLTETDETPSSEIDPEAFTGSHPMALRIAQKIRRKTQAALRRRQTRKSRQENTGPAKKPALPPQQQQIDARGGDIITLELNEATVGRLLWLKQNHALWMKAIRCVVDAIAGSDLPGRIARQLNDNLNALFAYIRPLIVHASDYHSTPRRFRPRFASVIPITS